MRGGLLGLLGCRPLGALPGSLSQLGLCGHFYVSGLVVITCPMTLVAGLVFLGARRFCGKCHAQAIADERHLVFECSAVQPIRDRYPSLFTGPGQTMQQFMWQADIVGVVHFIRDSVLVLLDHNPEGGDGARLALSPQPWRWNRCGVIIIIILLLKGK